MSTEGSAPVTKQVHNARVRVAAGSKTIVEEVIARADAMARKGPDEALKSVVREDDEIWHGELWLDRQQPVRRFVRALKEALGPEACATIAQHPTRFIDTDTHCFIHLNRTAFLNGKCELAAGSDTVAIRLNVAAYPATKEKAIPALRELFS